MILSVSIAQLLHVYQSNMHVHLTLLDRCTVAAWRALHAIPSDSIMQNGRP